MTGLRVLRQRVLGALRRRGWLVVVAPFGDPIRPGLYEEEENCDRGYVLGESTAYREVRPLLEAARRVNVEPILAFTSGKRIRFLSAQSRIGFV